MKHDALRRICATHDVTCTTAEDTLGQYLLTT